MEKDMEQASLLIKCIQQRNNTMRQLMEKLVSIQKSFIIHGEMHLAPLTRAFLANELEVHESTISRAVANKTVQLPNKRSSRWQPFSTESSVRAILRKIVDEERHALNDTEIRKTLESHGIYVNVERSQNIGNGRYLAGTFKTY